VIILAKTYLKSFIKSKRYGEHITLDLVVATQLMSSAHRLIMVITCAKLFQNIFRGLKVLEQTPNEDYFTFDL
jgi:hypothetical protein